MARRSRSSRRRSIDDDEEEEMEVEEEEQQQDDEDDEPRGGSRRRRNSKSGNSRGGRRRRQSIEKEDEDDDNDSDDDDMMFHSQAPVVMTQEFHPVKENEQNNFLGLTEEKRDSAVSNLARLVLFKAMSYEPIDRTKCLKDAGVSTIVGSNTETGSAGKKISTAVYDVVRERLQNLFGFDMKRMPEYMEHKMKNGSVPAKCANQYYVINTIEDGTGKHSKCIHSVHDDTTIEHGVLMLVLALTYCKGDPKHDGSRWILDKDLYYLLNCVDENLPSEPPAAGSKKKRTTQQSQATLTTQSQRGGGGSNGGTPNIDTMLELFVKREYLLKQKATDQQVHNNANNANGNGKIEPDSYFYSMGPRAALEIGRRQIVYYCGEILDQDPDPTMLKEIDDQENCENDEETDNEEEE